MFVFIKYLMYFVFSWKRSCSASYDIQLCWQWYKVCSYTSFKHLL